MADKLDVHQVVHLLPGEDLLETAKCTLKTTADLQTWLGVQIKSHQKKIEVKGAIAITDHRLLFIQDTGLVFKERKLLLELPYEEIAGSTKTGILTKMLVVSLRSKGKTAEIQFIGLKDLDRYLSLIRQLTSDRLDVLGREKRRSKEVAITIGEEPSINKTWSYKCDKCDAKVKFKAKFCPDCGHKLTSKRKR